MATACWSGPKTGRGVSWGDDPEVSPPVRDRRRERQAIKPKSAAQGRGEGAEVQPLLEVSSSSLGVTVVGVSTDSVSDWHWGSSQAAFSTHTVMS